MKELDFSLATTQEIVKELARRAKQKRKRDMSYYGDQKAFAKHIGMNYRSYQQFEISGKITLEKFIDVLRGLDALEESQELLNLRDEDLFKEKGHRNKPKYTTSFKNIDEDNDNIVDIPDVFNNL